MNFQKCIAVKPGSIVLGFTFFLSLSAVGHANMVSDETAWGRNCNNPKSFAVKLRNASNQSKDFRVCIERAGGDWGCFTNFNTAPGEVYPPGWGFMVCDGTGRYKWWDRPAGTYESFPNP